jgi:DNA adenine methylase
MRLLPFREEAASAKPFLKWAGGKGQILEELAKRLPEELRNRKLCKYAEPFIGGGAMFLYVAQKYPHIERYYIADVNQELILAYQTIKREVDRLILLLEQLERRYHAKSPEEQKEFFYKTREHFKAQLAEIDFDHFHAAWAERTATLIFLNRTCFNGLFRVNSRGEFNVPFGRYKNPRICDGANLRALSGLLQQTEIECADFGASERFIDEHTFAYFDPPYRPISRTANFTSYSKYEFNDDSQRRLADYFRLLDRKGAKLLLSNSDPKNADPNDHFFEHLYQDFHLGRIDANRMINSDAAKRGPIKELVITNYGGLEGPQSEEENVVHESTGPV